jgi:hypothetical protein
MAGSPYRLPPLLLLLATSASQAWTQQVDSGAPGASLSDIYYSAPARRVAASRVEVAPVIDGMLDEDTWATIQPTGEFTPRVPRDGEPATQETRLFVLFDDKALYIGLWMLDSDVEGIVQGEAIRDFDLQESGGMARRMQRGAGSGFNINWDGDWSVSTHQDDAGWSANIRFARLNRAGTGFFFVYNEAQGVNSLSGPFRRQLILKFNHDFNLWGG